MLSVDGDPPERAFGRGGAHDGGAFPVHRAESPEHVGKESCRLDDLTLDVDDRLLRVAVMLYAFFYSHWGHERTFGSPRDEHPLPVHEQDIPDVTAVLKDRPGAGLRPAAHVSCGVSQKPTEIADAVNDLVARRRRAGSVVHEATFVAALHQLTITPVSRAGAAVGQ